MSMTKKEIAELEAMRSELQLVAALRWTEPIAPDVPIPEGQKLSTGWVTGYNRVDVACSSSIFHSYGRTDKTTCQSPCKLFSTKLRALKALRYEMERRFAGELARVDRQIALEPQPQ